jgi:hypothetical protein
VSFSCCCASTVGVNVQTEGVDVVLDTRVVMTDSTIVAVSVVWTVVTGVMVALLLTTGVMVVVLRAVCVTVIEVVIRVCKQEHTNLTSEDGRERMLENRLALAVGKACLLRMVMDTVVLMVSVSVL